MWSDPNGAATVTADAGYLISGILVGNSWKPAPLTSPYTVSFANVQADQTVKAYFAPTQHVINGYVMTTGGTMPALTTVARGGSTTVSIEASPGYVIDKIRIGNSWFTGPFVSPHQLSFTNMTADQNVWVYFRPQ